MNASKPMLKYYNEWDLQVLRLVTELRQAGHFTAVALTRPFEFEGKRRAEAAETLISALEEAAHFVTVIEQVRTHCNLADAIAIMFFWGDALQLEQGYCRHVLWETDTHDKHEEVQPVEPGSLADAQGSNSVGKHELLT